MCPVSDTGKTVLLDVPKEVDIESIEQELVQLWKGAGEGSSSVVRACSLNLVIFTEGEGRTSGLEEMVGQITLDHPGRIFLIVADRRSAHPGMDVWVSARCSLPVSGEKQVCCEEINVTVSGTETRKVPSIVTSLLVPDVPTILLWRAMLNTRDTLLELLSQISERVLIDSSEELNPLESLVMWSTFMRERKCRAACGDLAWTHLTRWRGLLAQAFQPSETRAHLATLDHITVEYTSTRTPMHSGLSQSFLVSAWLSHVLRWVPVRPFREEDVGVFTAKLRHGEQAVTIHLSDTPLREARPGGIESISLHSTTGGELVLRSVGGREDCILLRSSLPGSPAREDILMVHPQTEPELVSKELEVLYNDPMFESAMSILAKMLSGEGS